MIDHMRGRDLDRVIGKEITDQDHVTEEGGSDQSQVIGDQDHVIGDQDHVIGDQGHVIGDQGHVIGDQGHVKESTHIDQDQSQGKKKRVSITASLKVSIKALLVNISTSQNKT